VAGELVVAGAVELVAGVEAAELLLLLAADDLKNVESNCAPPTAAATLITKMTAGLS